MINFMKLICSIPIIFLSLYFIPFLGICLIITRYFVYKKKYYSMPIILIVIGLLILIPKIIEYIIITFKLNSIEIISQLSDNINYIKLIKFSKFILCVGVIFLIISFIIKSIMEKIGRSIGNYIKNIEERDAEISRQNDLIMKQKIEDSKNTKFVHCPHCGADNIVKSNTEKCKYCRRNLKI